MNALFSLIVPLAGAALFAAMDKKDLVWIPRLIVVFAMVSALLGLLQIAGSPGGPLYLYRITNESSAVGLFANRNHNAAFLAASIPVAACLAALGQWLPDRINRKAPRTIVNYAIFLPILIFLVVAIIASGSRAGLLLAGPMVAAAALIFALHAASERRKEERSNRRPQDFAKLRNYFWAAPIVGGALAGTLALLGGRGDAVARLLSGQANDLRFNVFPDLLIMLGDFFPTGAGFGAFTHVYPQYERDEMLVPQYLNQAHNDWLQVLIEGGLPAAALMVAVILLLANRARIVLFTKSLDTHARIYALSFLSFIACVAIASVVDYPARTPSIMLTLSLAFCIAVHVCAVAKPRQAEAE